MGANFQPGEFRRPDKHLRTHLYLPMKPSPSEQTRSSSHPVEGSPDVIGSVSGQSPPLRRRRGRPTGKPMPTVSGQPGHHHFSFLRAVVQGVDLRRSWTLYLSFEGGSETERYIAARHREIEELVVSAAVGRGMESRVRTAMLGQFGGGDGALTPQPEPVAFAGSATLGQIPSLDEWITERCEQIGVDVDFQSQAEWLQEYEDEFGLNRAEPVLKATALPSPIAIGTGPGLPSLAQRLAALSALESALARPPSLDDDVSAWFVPDLCKRMAFAWRSAEFSMSGPGPSIRLRDLIDFVNLRGNRWWRCVPRIGGVRAKRMIDWLAPLARTLGYPLDRSALVPQHELVLAERESKGAAHRGPGCSGFGLLETASLKRLHDPRAFADGRLAGFSMAGAPLLPSPADLAAIRGWLDALLSEHTRSTYTIAVERFYLWCLLVRGLPLSSLSASDLPAYQAFLREPPAHWIQARQHPRESAAWRPFNGVLSASSQRLNMAAVRSLLVSLGRLEPKFGGTQQPSLSGAEWPAGLHDKRAGSPRSGGLGAVAGHRVARRVEAESSATLDEAGDDQGFASGVRNRLVAALLEETGLSLSKIVGLRFSDLGPSEGSSSQVVQADRSGRQRALSISRRCRALIDDHWVDRARSSGTPDAPPSPSSFLVGPLRGPVPQWSRGPDGLPVLYRQDDRTYSLSQPVNVTAMRQALERYTRAGGG